MSFTPLVLAFVGHLQLETERVSEGFPGEFEVEWQTGTHMYLKKLLQNKTMEILEQNKHKTTNKNCKYLYGEKIQTYNNINIVQYKNI